MSEHNKQSALPPPLPEGEPGSTWVGPILMGSEWCAWNVGDNAAAEYHLRGREWVVCKPSDAGWPLSPVLRHAVQLQRELVEKQKYILELEKAVGEERARAERAEKVCQTQYEGFNNAVAAQTKIEDTCKSLRALLADVRDDVAAAADFSAEYEPTKPQRADYYRKQIRRIDLVLASADPELEKLAEAVVNEPAEKVSADELAKRVTTDIMVETAADSTQEVSTNSVEPLKPRTPVCIDDTQVFFWVPRAEYMDFYEEEYEDSELKHQEDLGSIPTWLVKRAVAWLTRDDDTQWRDGYHVGYEHALEASQSRIRAIEAERDNLRKSLDDAFRKYSQACTVLFEERKQVVKARNMGTVVQLTRKARAEAKRQAKAMRKRAEKAERELRLERGIPVNEDLPEGWRGEFNGYVKVVGGKPLATVVRNIEGKWIWRILGRAYPQWGGSCLTPEEAINAADAALQERRY